MKAPASGAGADRRIDQDRDDPGSSGPRQTKQALVTPLHCAGCGAEGHPPVIVYDRAQAPPGRVLTPVFNWHADGRPALLCGPCKALAYAARKTGRARP